MRQLRRILRLQYEGNSTRDIVRVTGIARTTVQLAGRMGLSDQRHQPLITPGGYDRERLRSWDNQPKLMAMPDLGGRHEQHHLWRYSLWSEHRLPKDVQSKRRSFAATN